MSAISWSKPCNALIAAEDSGDLKVYEVNNTDSCQQISAAACLSDHSDIVNSVCSLEKSTCAITGSWDKTVKLWDLQNESSSCVRTYEGHSRPVSSVAMNPTDDATFVSCSYDFSLKFWDVRTENAAEAMKLDYTPFCATWSRANGNEIAVGHEEGVISLLDRRKLTKDENVVKIDDSFPIHSISHSPKGNKIAFGSDDGVVRLMCLRDKSIYILGRHDDYCTTLAWEELGAETLYSGGWDGQIITFDAADLKT